MYRAHTARDFVSQASLVRFGQLGERLRVNTPQPINWRLILQLSSTMLAIAILPVIVGVLIDARLHTTPVVTLCMMFLGFNLGIIALYRRIAVIYSSLAPPEPANVTPQLEQTPVADT